VAGCVLTAWYVLGIENRLSTALQIDRCITISMNPFSIEATCRQSGLLYENSITCPHSSCLQQETAECQVSSHFHSKITSLARVRYVKPDL
jgi:hypothetical protein